MLIQVDNWDGCYDMGWQGLIVPEAFAHPAKVSRGLIRRIYKHAFEEGWLKHGNTICDPFGGIGGTALDAMWNRCHWVGVELEPRFVVLAEQNIALWHRKFGSNAGWGTARMVQGDSRNLMAVRELKRGFNRMRAGIPPSMDMIIGSPPYAESNTEPTKMGLGKGTRSTGESADRSKGDYVYGDSPGQLGRMKEGQPPSVDMVISSPPFADMLNQSGGGIYARGEHTKTAVGQQLEYGRTPGQLGAMPEGKFDAIVSSPPYESALSNSANNIEHTGGGGPIHPRNYGEKAENLGNQSGETFWTAARIIIQQCHQILRPGGHAIWICKDFVRKKKRVPFSGQWQALCEAEGFRLVCRHRAMLVTHHGEHGQLFGGSEQLKTERKSFFRRLAEKKGSPAIDFEDVICLERA